MILQGVESSPLLRGNKGDIKMEKREETSTIRENDRDLLIPTDSARTVYHNVIMERIKKVAKDYRSVLIGTAIATLCLVLLGTLVWKDKFGWQAWITIAIVYFTFLALIMGVWTTELIMMANATSLLAFQIITPAEALEGFSNPSIITICAMFCIAAGIQHTGALEFAVKYLLRTPPNVFQAQLRMMVPVAIVSAFVNNTPIVAMMIPVMEQWSRTIRISPSKLMIPLSYATIIGGTCTLVGTSTNLIVVSFLEQVMPDVHVGLFEMGKVGAPLVIVTLIYILFFSRWLLPDRISGAMDIDKIKEYAVTAQVSPSSNLIGKSIQTSLRSLRGLYLVEVEREDGYIITAVSPDTEIHANDMLTFVGKVDDVRELWNISGLHPVNHESQVLKPDANRILVEAVVASHSELIGKTPRQCNFRTRYGAVIVSVHREGEHIRSKIGSIVLQVGDCLLLQCKEMKPLEVYNHDFIAVSELPGSSHAKIDFVLWRMLLSIAVSITVIVLNAVELVELLTGALVGTFILLITRCVTAQQIYSAVNIPLIVTIAGSFGMATAMENTGVAAELSENLTSIFQSWGKVGLLLSIYFCTMLLTALLSNASSVALMFPIAWRMTQLSWKSRVYILMFAASADFSTPIGYQTNLMVYGPGGYKFLDYARIGLPLQLVLCVASVFLTLAIYE